MRKLLLILFFVFPQVNCFPQEKKVIEKPQDPKAKNEIGLNLFSCFYYFEYSVSPFVIGNVFPGVYYKRHFGQNALRFSFDHYQNNLNELSPAWYQPSSPISNWITKQDLMKIGYQRQFGKKRLLPFIYGDALLGLTRQTFIFDERDYYFSSSFCGIASGGGLKYQANKYLAFSYEFSVMYGVSTKYLGYGGFVFLPVKQIGVSFTF